MMILDIFKYFGQFPQRQAVLDLFFSNRSEMAGYASLKAYIETMSIHSRIPSISGFAFGENEASVKKHVLDLTGTFMYVDFGELSTTRDQKNSITNTFRMGVTIAMKTGVTLDAIEYAIASDETMKLVQSMLQLMTSDQAENAWIKELSSDYETVPFDAPDWQAHGWTILFNRKGADMLNVKNL